MSDPNRSDNNAMDVVCTQPTQQAGDFNISAESMDEYGENDVDRPKQP